MEHGQLIFMMWVEHESRLESIRVATSNEYLNGELNQILGREVDVGIAVRSIVRQGKLVMISTGPYGCILAKAAHLTVPACDQSAVEAAPGKILEAMVAPEIVAGALLAAVRVEWRIFSRVRALLVPFSDSSVSQHVPENFSCLVHPQRFIPVYEGHAVKMSELPAQQGCGTWSSVNK